MFNTSEDKNEKKSLSQKEEVKPLSGEKEDNVETVIGPSVKVEGEFIGNGDVVVEGMVVGTLKTSRDLRIAEGAVVNADITARNIIVAGRIIGNVKVKETSQLTSTAHITGDVQTQVLQIDSGAVMNGRCISGTKEDREEARDGDVKKKVLKKNKSV